MKVKVIGPYDYSPRLKVGDTVTVDKIKKVSTSQSGYMLRVIGLWKNPIWLDLAWFDLRQNRNAGNK